MTQPDRAALFARLQHEAIAACAAAGHPEDELRAEAFFEDELLFLSVSRYDAAGELRWRSSHAGTPDSAALGHLSELGAELLDRVSADAKLASAVTEDGDD